MKKQDALDLIKELQKELTIDNVRNQFWMDKVHGYVQFIFGDNTQSIALPMFGTYYWDRPFTKWEGIEGENIVNKLKGLFTTYEQMIKKGVYFRKNIASDYTTPEIVVAISAIVVALITSFGGVVYSVGQSIG